MIANHLLKLTKCIMTELVSTLMMFGPETQLKESLVSKKIKVPTYIREGLRLNPIPPLSPTTSTSLLFFHI